MQKVVDFSEKKAELTNEVTIKSLVTNLFNAINNGEIEIESIVYISKEKDGTFNYGCNNMLFTEAIGMLEVGKHLIMNDMTT